MVINTNVSSLLTQNYMNQNNVAMQKTMEDLSSGYKINSAADDPAGLAIVQQMNSAIGGIEQAVQNANDGISLIQTADGAESSISSILETIRNLAVEADNGTNSSSDVASLQQEASELLQEIDHISNVTQFNGVNLLSNNTSLNLHISNLYNDVMTISLYDVSTTSLGISGINLTTAPETAISLIDAAINSISNFRSDLGAYQNRLNYVISNLNTEDVNTKASRSGIEDANMAQEMSSLSQEQILAQSSISMLTQANSNAQLVLKLLQ